MTREISNTDEIIDSRDVIKRIEELESEVGSLVEEYMEEHGLDELNDGDIPADWDDWEPKEELDILTALAEEASGYAPDWEYGAALIHRDHFVNYCMELLADIGDLPAEIPHYIVIDEQATADNLEADYSSVDFDGQEYLIR